MDVLSGCLSSLGENAAKALFRQCSYAVKYKRNISELNFQLQKLDDLRAAVKIRLIEAEANLETVFPAVEKWLLEVEAVIEEKAAMFDNHSESKARYCSDWCPNPKACHSLGRKATKMAARVEDLHSRGTFLAIAYISASPPRNNIPPAGPSRHTHTFESRASVVRDVMEALKVDGRDPVVVLGMSGVGKTTMLREIYTGKEASALFGKVLLVEVSREEGYLSEIQKEIADALGLKRLSEVANLGKRKELLAKRLNSEKVLVMLDDVWEFIDFEGIGIPLGGDCKVLITTRFHHLYGHVSAERKFVVNGLARKEAWNLFKETAGSNIESHLFKPIAEEIVRKCDGLPIAISTFGSALHGKKAAIWKDALRRLENPSSENVSEESVVTKLLPNIKFCHERLESKEAKNFFFLCCVYPEGSDIEVEDLVRHGLGLGLFRKISSMVQARDRVEALIDRLKDRSLLLESKKKGCVKVHDLVRRVALLLDPPPSNENSSRGRFLTNYGPELIVEILGNSDIPENRESQIVFSLADYSKKPVPEATDKVLLCKRVSPSPLQRWETIHTLSLEHCDLGFVSFIGDLKMLVILSLRHSSVLELPRSFGNLSHLWLLDLTGCTIKFASSKIFSFRIISGLRNLQELYMLVHRSTDEDIPENDYKRYKAVSEIELCWQCSLTTLEIDLPKVSLRSLQESRIFDNLERFKISIGCSDRWDNVPSSNNCLRLDVHTDLLTELSPVTKLLKKAQIIEIAMHVTEGIHLVDQLTYLKFQGCGTLEEVVSYIRKEKCKMNAFPVLRSMTTQNSKVLVSLCESQSSVELFKELRRVEMRYCLSLSSLFSLHMATKDNLDQLEELDIQHSSKLEEIVASNGDMKICRLSNLIRLELVNLENFIRFSRMSICFPLLINIQLEKLPKLVSLCPNDGVSSSSQATRQHLFDAMEESLLELRFVKVLNCDSISSMFSSDCVPSLQSLEYLTVQHCRSLITLFDFEDGDSEFIKRKKSIKFEDGVTSTLSNIQELRLINLPNLEYIWKPPQEIQAFESCISVKIDGCSLLKNVFPSYIAEGLVKLQHLSVRNCCDMSEIIHSDGESTSKVFTLKAESLELDDLPCLKTFCYSHERMEWPLLRKLVLTNLPSIDNIFELLLLHSDSTQVAFPMLEELRITNIARIPFQTWQSFPKLEVLSVSHCETVKEIIEFSDAGSSNINSQSAGNPQISNSDMRFRNLKTLSIKSCSNLTTLLPLSAARSLVRLEKLSVSSCSRIKEIVSKPNENSAAGEIPSGVLPNLTCLKLIDLPYLTTFMEGNSDLEWPLLKKFKFGGSPSMRSFYSGTVRTPNLLQTGISASARSKPRSMDINTIVYRSYIEEVSKLM